VAGKYPSDSNSSTAPGTLVKQFPDFYIAYSTPQSICGNQQSSGTNKLFDAIADFKKSLSSTKAL
jgi:hypothetical protein